MHDLRQACLFLLVVVAAGCGGPAASPDGGGGDGATPPPAPTVDHVASPTSMNPLTLTGTGRPGATVQVRGGVGTLASATAGTDGHFSVPVMLHPDTANTLLVSQTVAGAEGPSVSVAVTHDGMAPHTPTIDTVTTPTRRVMQAIHGGAEAGAMIRIRGGMADAMGTADASGRYNVTALLNSGGSGVTTNTLSVVAIDAAGNTSGPAMATIVVNPSLPLDAPAVDPVTSPTNSATLTLTGTAEASVHVTVAGGAAPAAADADASGHFSAMVMLRPNMENVLSVFAVVPATGVTSAAATVTVVHDDIAPAAPSVDPVASPTGADMVPLTGHTEPMAGISITGGAAAATATADASGTFSTRVALTHDAVNTLAVVATDLATNASAPQTITVQQDSTLPVPVEVDSPASPTRDNPILLTGRTVASASVLVSGGAAPAMATAAADGTFSVSVTLTANSSNELHVTRVGASTDTIVVVVHDNVAPAAPVLNTISSPTNLTNIDVSGTAEAGATISVSGATATATGSAGSDGRFSVGVTIAADTTTTLSVIATDRAGNTSSAVTAMVTHSSTAPDAPVVDDSAPPPTNAATYTVRGHVTAPAAGITIHISGGASAATGPADPSTGVFAVDVTLSPNAVNQLHVTSVNGAITSPETIVTITHDNMAPAAPVGTSITVASPPPLAMCPVRTSLSVTGAMSAVEAASTVRVTNMATSSMVTTTATAGGSFTTSMSGCRGDIFSIVAIDAAGNVSTSTEKTVL